MNVRIASATTIRSGVITSRIEACSASRRSSCIATRLRDQPLDLAERALVGQLEVQERARERARGGEQRVLAPEHLVQPPLRGVRERQQPQRLAGRGAVDHDHVPVAGLVVRLEREQAEQLVAAGRDGQLLGGDPVDAALHQHAAEPLLHARPVALELVLGLDLLGEQAAADVRRLAADGRLERLGERVGGIRGEHDRARALRGAAPGGRRGDRRLPDSALARVEDGPGRHKPRQHYPRFFLRGLSTSTSPVDRAGVAREVARRERDRVDPGAPRHLPAERVRPAREAADEARVHELLPARDPQRDAGDLVERHLELPVGPAAEAPARERDHRRRASGRS